MDYESAVIEFLAQKENAGLVFDIVDRAEQVKDKLLLKFWRALETKARDKLGGPTGWTTSLRPERDLLKAKEYGGFYIRPSLQPSRYVYIQMLQDDGFRLEYGIAWNAETKKPPELEEINGLREMLKGMGYETGRWSEWWLGIKRTPWVLREKQPCVRISGDDSLEEELATSLVELFKAVKKPLEQANQALAII